MIPKYCFIFSLFLIHYSTYAQDKINKNIEILEIERSIDLSSQLVKVLTKIVFENTGSSETSYFLYAIEPEIAKYLSYIGAQVNIKLIFWPAMPRNPTSCHLRWIKNSWN